MNRPQRVLMVVALGMFFLLFHAIGVDYYRRQEDPNLNVILLFRIRVADFALLTLWAVSGLAVLRKW